MLPHTSVSRLPDPSVYVIEGTQLTPISQVQRMFILVVENNDSDAQRLAFPLRSVGHEVFMARSEEQAARTLLVHPCDVIVINTDLRGEDGPGAAERLCGPMRNRPVLVAMTSESSAEERSTPVGFDHHVGKPVDAAGLVEVLRRHAGRTQSGAPRATVGN
jgi:CheY-like chemotaxis protein